MSVHTTSVTTMGEKASGAVIFRKNDEMIEYLLLRAYNYWDFAKGRIEDGEDYVETAIREIEEETDLKKITFVTRNKEKLFIETTPYGRNRKIARYYLCFVSMSESKNVKLKINPEIGKPEHDEFNWCQCDKAITLLNKRLKTVIDWADSKVKGAI